MNAFFLLAQASPSRVGDGVLVGGWGYIWAGYALSAVFLIGYAVSLRVRRPRSQGTS